MVSYLNPLPSQKNFQIMSDDELLLLINQDTPSHSRSGSSTVKASDIPKDVVSGNKSAQMKDHSTGSEMQKHSNSYPIEIDSLDNDIFAAIDSIQDIDVPLIPHTSIYGSADLSLALNDSLTEMHSPLLKMKTHSLKDLATDFNIDEHSVPVNSHDQDSVTGPNQVDLIQGQQEATDEYLDKEVDKKPTFIFETSSIHGHSVENQECESIIVQNNLQLESSSDDDEHEGPNDIGIGSSTIMHQETELNNLHIEVSNVEDFLKDSDNSLTLLEDKPLEPEDNSIATDVIANSEDTIDAGYTYVDESNILLPQVSLATLFEEERMSTLPEYRSFKPSFDIQRTHNSIPYVAHEDMDENIPSTTDIIDIEKRETQSLICSAEDLALSCDEMSGPKSLRCTDKQDKIKQAVIETINSLEMVAVAQQPKGAKNIYIKDWFMMRRRTLRLNYRYPTQRSKATRSQPMDHCRRKFS